MGLRWATKTIGRRITGKCSAGGSARETSKPVVVLIIPAFSANNQPVPQTNVGSNRFRSGVQNGIVTVISCGVAGGGK